MCYHCCGFFLFISNAYFKRLYRGKIAQLNWFISDLNQNGMQRTIETQTLLTIYKGFLIFCPSNN